LVRIAALLLALAASSSVPFRHLAQASPPGETPAKPLVALTRYIDYLRPRDVALVKRMAPTRLAIAVFAGEKPTGGYTIKVTRLTLAAGKLTVTAQVTPPDGAATDVISSPYDVITIARPARLPKTWVLRDPDGITLAAGAFSH
jgi:PrcB C-terminal